MYIRDVYCTVRFVWDPDKNTANVAKRGIALSEAARVFGGPTLERYDGREDYGEDRYIAVGLAEGRALVIVYTDVNEDNEDTRRIISARRATTGEARAYAKAYPPR
jgi:uncharacterized DUF497 family protein